jgi:hypothetical protein
VLHELVAGHARTLIAELGAADPEGGGLPRSSPASMHPSGAAASTAGLLLERALDSTEEEAGRCTKPSPPQGGSDLADAAEPARLEQSVRQAAGRAEGGAAAQVPTLLATVEATEHGGEVIEIDGAHLASICNGDAGAQARIFAHVVSAGADGSGR